jgi:hypothetical protein
MAALAVVEAMLAGTLARLGDAARERMSKIEETSGADKVIGGAEFIQQPGKSQPIKKRR